MKGQETFLIFLYLISCLRAKRKTLKFGMKKMFLTNKNLKVESSKFFSHNVFILICNTGTLKNQSCLSLLTTINQIINNWELDSKNSSNLLRIVVSSFGSPHWNFSEKEISTDFTATLFLLKSLIRSANVVAVITIPHQLLNASVSFFKLKRKILFSRLTYL